MGRLEEMGSAQSGGEKEPLRSLWRGLWDRWGPPAAFFWFQGSSRRAGNSWRSLLCPLAENNLRASLLGLPESLREQGIPASWGGGKYSRIFLLTVETGGGGGALATEEGGPERQGGLGGEGAAKGG